MASPSDSSNGSSGIQSNPFQINALPSIPASSITMINIQAHVPITLDLGDSHFSAWHQFFNLTFQKFGVTNHIDGTLDAALMFHDSEWLQVDSCIVMWLYSSVSKDLRGMIMVPHLTAYSVWTSICNLFLDNTMQRAVYAQQEFHSLYQGDLSVNDYCSRLMDLADTLRDIGSPVSDMALVLNTLHSLNPKFHQEISVLTS